MSNPESSEALKFLRQRYLEKLKANPKYSLTAYARDLGLSPSFVSRLMTGKRPITMQLATQIATICGMSASETARWVSEIILNAPKNAKISTKVRNSILKNKNIALVKNYDVERFSTISHWYHLAILNLTMTKGFRANVSWISKRLSITTVEAQDALSRLLALGLLKKEGKTLICTDQSFFVATKKSNLGVREFHKQMSIKAQEILNDQAAGAFEKRYIAGVTMALNQKQISHLQQRLKEIQLEIIQFAKNRDDSAEEVYQLNLQLFPLTKTKNKTE